MSDIEVFDVQGRRLAELAAKLWDHAKKYPEECDAFLRVQRELREHVAIKLKFAGGAETEDSGFDGLGELLGLNFKPQE